MGTRALHTQTKHNLQTCHQHHTHKPQEAYETLSDPAKRREFDSTDEFDDTLPTGCDPADFFKVRGAGGWTGHL